MSPWQVLGIPYGSPRSVVKEAYARLLKEHRPDRDPVGFRRIRDAYELLRDVPEQVEHEAWEEEEPTTPTFAAEPAPYPIDADGEEGEDDEEGHEVEYSGDDEEPPEEPESEDLSPQGLPRRPPFHLRLSRALYRMSVQTDPQRELRLLRVLVHTWRQGKRAPIMMVNLLLTALRQKPLVQTLLTPTDVANELDGGGWAVTIALLKAYLAGDDTASVSGVLAAIESWSARHPTGNCGPLLVEAAGVLAFVDHAAAERLLDTAFRCRVGHQPIDHVELRLAAGRELRASKRADQLLFTRALLLPPERRTEDDEIQAAAAMRQRHGSAPLLAALFKASLPKRWDHVIAAPIEVLPPHQVKPLQPDRPHDPMLLEPEARRLSRRESIAWLLAMLAILVIGRTVLRTPNNRPPTSFGMPRAIQTPAPEPLRPVPSPGQASPAVPPPAPGKPAGGR